MAQKSLTRSLADRAFDRIAIPAVPSEPAWVGDLVSQIDSDFMAGPPLTLHLPVPTVLAGIWAALRESALAGPTDRATRELIAAAVSSVNECPFCIDSHTAAASALGQDGAAKAVRSGAFDAVEPDDIRAAARWAAATQTPDDPLLTTPPFTPADEPYAIGTALAFHYINRMVSAFLKPWPVTVPAFINRRPFMTRVNAVFPGHQLGVSNLVPGASLRFCPPSPLGPELARLAIAPAIAHGFGALFAAADDAGETVLSEASRSVVADAIAMWDGATPRLGSTLIAGAVAPLPGEEHAAATFALTCALASYRVDRRLVERVRATHPSDRELVSIAAYASARAVRRIATWI